MQRVPVTIEGKKLLEAELQSLKNVKRKEIIQAIAEARAHGDLKENTEYHSAREQQGFIEAKIRSIESNLASVQVIDITKIQNTGKIIFGVTVSLLNQTNQKKVTYKIVGDDEANIENNKISIHAPLSRLLINKRKNDEITLETVNGNINYKILEVLYI